MSQPHLELLGQFLVASNKPSDINEHISTLQYYASQCSHITECGVRTCVSSWAFLYGLVHSPPSERQKILIGIDLDFHENMLNIYRVSNSVNVLYRFFKNNDLNVDLEETDLLFIDTWHVYGQLKRELEKMSPFVRKYIIMHDTEVDGELGESIRLNLDIPKQVSETGWAEEEIRKGLKPAIQEFLQNHPEFILREHFIHNNGLTILQRIQP